MIILWSILSTIGLIVAVWYFTSVFNPYGRLNYPMLLWKSIGHHISWFLIVIGGVSLIMLYRSTQGSTLFFKIVGGMFLIMILVKTKLTPMRMSFIDVMGSLYSAAGLRFGGFQTAQFLEVTEDIEKLQPGVRHRIVAEAHYLVSWLHRFPEIAFFLTTLFSGSLLIGFFCFIGAYLLEMLRFYALGASPLVSHLCRIWGWIKVPLFLGSAAYLWPEGKLIPLAFVLFLILQGWFGLISTVVMLPIRVAIAILICRAFGKKHPHIHNMEALAVEYVIVSWRMKLLPPEEAFKFCQMGKEDIEFYKLHSKESYTRAYEKRPFLSGVVFSLWLLGVINVIKALYFLVTGDFGNMGISFLGAVLLFIFWYLIHNWALKHPKLKHKMEENTKVSSVIQALQEIGKSSNYKKETKIVMNALKGKPITVFDHWSEEDFESEEDEYPWEDVIACRNIKKSPLTRKTEREVNEEVKNTMKPCPMCGKTFEEMEIFYFISPEYTWEDLCGRAGWIIVCMDCKKQISFLVEAMN